VKYPKSKLILTPAEAYPKLASFCAYQERTHNEVMEKLASFGIDEEEADDVIIKLIEDNYLNEGRFACTYASSKFRHKKWGRLKIIANLKQKGISSNCINLAMKEIEEDEYRNCVRKLAEKKWEDFEGDNILQNKQKLYFYLHQKGYEPSVIQEVTEDILN